MKRESVKGVNKNQIEQFSLQEDFVAPKIIIEIMLVTYVLIIGAAFGGALFGRFMDVAIYIYAFALLMIVAFDQKLKFKDLLYIMLFALYCFSTTFFNGGGLGSVATMALPLVLLCCYEYSNFGEYSKFIIKTASLICNVVFIIVSTLFKFNGDLRVGVLNSNTVCIMAIISFALWTIFTDLKRKENKVLFILLSLSTFLIINYLHGRGSLLSLVALLLVYIIPKKILTKKVFIIAICTIFVFSFLFPLIYLIIYNSGVNFTFFGKTLYTGREGIWQNMLNAFSEKGISSVLFGLGSKAELWAESSSLNVHHENYAIMVNFGIFGLIFYYSFIIKKLIKAFKHFDNEQVRKSFYFIFALMVLGFVESVSFWAVLYVFTLSAVGITIALSNKIESNSLHPLYKSVDICF